LQRLRSGWPPARSSGEKELTRRGDELARERRELPWMRVERE
jgi:predicted dithiol-disulfide oxidoreductase (DUF899 family)